MISISLCMIVKNEAEALGRCLDSAAPIVDEIVIVDLGSRDRTREIAFQFTDRLLHSAWADDFSAARNYAFDVATQDYILWLDAGDVLLPSDQQKLLKLKQTLQTYVDYVSMLYEFERDEYGNVTHSLRRNRLVKRSCHFRWHDTGNEQISVNGHFLLSDIAISRQSFEDAKPGRYRSDYITS